MPNLPLCVSGLYEPGAIGSDTGTTPVHPILTSLFNPDEPYDPASPTYSLDFSRFYNSLYLGGWWQ